MLRFSYFAVGTGMDKTKLFLSYMPKSVYQIPPVIKSKDSTNRIDKSLINIIPKNKRESYDIMPIIKSILDKSSFFEIPDFCSSSPMFT